MWGNLDALTDSAPRAADVENPPFYRIENWLDGEKDQLPLWIPVGIGTGIAIWQYFGDDAIIAVVLFCLAIFLFGLGFGRASRLSAVLKGAGVTLLIGFAVIMLKSTLVSSPVLAKIWVGEFYGRISKVEILSARDVVRLQLETAGHQALPAHVRVNLKPEQYQESFQPGAVIRLRARLMPPAGPALPTQGQGWNTRRGSIIKRKRYPLDENQHDKSGNTRPVRPA